ncbi:type III-A CRISPR-associated RAMP protein Csm4 [Candidatus Methylomicrobium oryzae]|jgi:CRISPR-associated protein Csm4|uniref:type III-A CRISPR-associated RAMP protein Csm4 n=1 Tax=Candidatus Methylomicrobium oryzae TaxID=2802053 RepID=UPI001924EBB8|nr:CRISPR-associated protein Csm7 [Methylomicrobium sp. RS1]MBL1266000.1 CRISPR-associated protein Csm7 [Methylomicrobium sp. RS1]
MKTYRITLNLQSAFATPMKGDTLFGQLCWAIRNRLGETMLSACLDGYRAGRPFAVLSDAFPKGYLPLPKLPGFYYEAIPGADRKAVKRRCWLPESAVAKPLAQWLSHAETAADIAGKAGQLSQKHPQPHNSIDRRTGTTGVGAFAPYSIEQEWFVPGLEWSVYLLLDDSRLSADDCRQCLQDIGQIGFGRDAGIGLGKFDLKDFAKAELPAQDQANSCLTLAPCVPQGQGYDGQRSFYQLFTRFGRHGDRAVHREGKPFKNPVLLAQTAAVFGVAPPALGFIGQGLGGDGSLSLTLPETVHQGYAPVIAIDFTVKERA